jgi:hypothetical protein
MPPPRAEQGDERAALHSLSLVNADQSFCGDVSDGRTRRAQLQDASNRQANDDESTDQHKDRGQSAFAGETGFAHSGQSLAGAVRSGYCTPTLRQPTAYTRGCALTG